jgi:hypothetical protein
VAFEALVLPRHSRSVAFVVIVLGHRCSGSMTGLGLAIRRGSRWTTPSSLESTCAVYRLVTTDCSISSSEFGHASMLVY